MLSLVVECREEGIRVVWHMVDDALLSVNPILLYSLSRRLFASLLGL